MEKVITQLIVAGSFRVNLVIGLEYPQDFGTGWGRAFGTFMIKSPTLGGTHWWEFVCTVLMLSWYDCVRMSFCGIAIIQQSIKIWTFTTPFFFLCNVGNVKRERFSWTVSWINLTSLFFCTLWDVRILAYKLICSDKKYAKQFLQILLTVRQKWLFMVASWVFHDKEIWRISVRLSDRSKVTQNKINFLKNCPQWGLNSQPLDHHSNALPAELGRNLLGRRFLKWALFVSCITSHVGLCSFLESIEHDFIKANRVFHDKITFTF